VIKSDAQLARTRAQIDGFRRACDETEAQPGLPKAAKAAVLASQRAMIAKLEAEIADYEELRRGRVRLPRLTSALDLGRALVAFRIAQGITQEQLAEMVGVSRQTINKYEEQEYQLATVDLVSHVATALGVEPEIALAHKTLEVVQATRSGPRTAGEP
jgi:DNA-binding XRE family transcriptional regulator